MRKLTPEEMATATEAELQRALGQEMMFPRFPDTTVRFLARDTRYVAQLEEELRARRAGKRPPIARRR